MTLPKKKLAALREFVIDAEEFDDDNVRTFLGMDTDADITSISDQLRREYPGDFGASDDAPVEAANTPPTTYHIVDDSNFVKDLELVRIKDGRVILRLKEPKDMVTLIVKGQTVEADLLRLRKLKADDVLHGVTVARLIELAEIAKC